MCTTPIEGQSVGIVINNLVSHLFSVVLPLQTIICFRTTKIWFLIPLLFSIHEPEATRNEQVNRQETTGRGEVGS